MIIPVQKNIILVRTALYLFVMTTIFALLLFTGSANGETLGLLVNNISSPDPEERAAQAFAALSGIDVIKIDPNRIAATPDIFSNIDGFWAASRWL
ncbi:MAG: hypothetical protein JXA92_12235 [candidate division Zixibacteria bacterium]|nr:hypothetical protein [candidate division Zixibacteria bacterium]